jgi:hypothetical protein
VVEHLFLSGQPKSGLAWRFQTTWQYFLATIDVGREVDVLLSERCYIPFIGSWQDVETGAMQWIISSLHEPLVALVLLALLKGGPPCCRRLSPSKPPAFLREGVATRVCTSDEARRAALEEQDKEGSMEADWVLDGAGYPG